MPWATIQQVTDQTGKVVTAEHLALASSIIDTYAGTDPAMPETSITARDRAILRKATAWQAVWIGSQPGYLEHRGVDYSPAADGTSAQRKSQADQDLAPLAQRELKNLSWVGRQMLDLRGGRSVPKGALMTDFLNESSDWWGSGENYFPSAPIGSSGNAGLTGWQEITGKPLVFPPDTHSHAIADVTGLQDALDAAGTGEGEGGGPVAWSEITGKPSTFPPAVHTHVVAWSDIASKPTAFEPVAHTHTQGQVDGLSATLAALTPLTTLEEVQTALEAADAALDGRITDLGTATATDLSTLDGRVDALEAAPGGGGSALVMRRAKITSGNLTLAVAGSWAAVAGGPSMVIPAAVGDYVEFSLPSMLANFGVNFVDLAVMVGGSIARTLSTDTATPATEGAPAFYGDQSFDRTSPVFEFEVEAGDLSGGNVTVQFITKGSGGGTIYASADYPLKWRALNYGPVS